MIEQLFLPFAASIGKGIFHALVYVCLTVGLGAWLL